MTSKHDGGCMAVNRDQRAQTPQQAHLEADEGCDASLDDLFQLRLSQFLQIRAG